MLWFRFIWQSLKSMVSPWVIFSLQPFCLYTLEDQGFMLVKGVKLYLSFQGEKKYTQSVFDTNSCSCTVNVVGMETVWQYLDSLWQQTPSVHDSSLSPRRCSQAWTWLVVGTDLNVQRQTAEVKRVCPYLGGGHTTGSNGIESVRLWRMNGWGEQISTSLVDHN